jgi:hypothetical protein
MSSGRSPLSLVAFLDERWKPLTRMIIGCCLFSRERWMNLHPHAAPVGEVRGKRRLEEIGTLLNRIGGFAVLGYADLPAELLQPGYITPFADMPPISRSDYAWSLMVLFAVTKSLALLHRRPDVAPETLDLYYDRKDLKPEHRAVVEQFLRRELPELAKEAAVKEPEHFPGDPGRLRLAVIRQVEKRRGATAPDALQCGVTLVDHVCRQSDWIISRDLAEGPIRVADFTKYIKIPR